MQLKQLGERLHPIHFDFFSKPKGAATCRIFKECCYEAILRSDNKAERSSGRQHPHTETDRGQQTDAVVVCLQALFSAQWLTVK